MERIQSEIKEKAWRLRALRTVIVMEENLIAISEINDFIFCPLSIYNHHLYNENGEMYQSEKQIAGKLIHEKIDEGKYISKKDILSGISIYSESLGVTGKIDTFDVSSGILTERKKKITKIYDGQIFQLYAQCLCLREMGYDVKTLKIYSYDDNKTYNIPLPETDTEKSKEFYNVLDAMRSFKIKEFKPDSAAKCMNCIYEPLCDRSLV